MLGFWSAVTLVVGHTIAVGIFLTPAELIGALAAPALTLGLWIGCGVMVLAGALTFGELAARYPRAGGLYVSLGEGWGERIAFLYGWQSLLVMDPGITAALAVGIGQYTAVLWPPARGWERLVAIAAIWILAGLNIAGLTLSTRILGLLTALKVLALGAIVMAAFTIGDGGWSNLVPFATRRAGAPPLIEAIALGLVGVFFSFGGFWEASRVAGEVRDPDRTLPRALIAGVAAVTAIYILTSVAFMYLVPAERMTSAEEFARRAGEAMLGVAGPGILAAIVVLSVAPSAMALLMMAPRLYLAMSRDGLFPAVLATVGSDGRTPARAITLLAILGSGFVLAGTFQQIVAFFLCTTLGFVALAAASLMVISRRESARLKPSAAFAPALFVLFVSAVVTIVAIARPVQALAGLGVVLLGLPARRMLLNTSGGTAV